MTYTYLLIILHLFHPQSQHQSTHKKSTYDSDIWRARGSPTKPRSQTHKPSRAPNDGQISPICFHHRCNFGISTCLRNIYSHCHCNFSISGHHNIYFPSCNFGIPAPQHKTIQPLLNLPFCSGALRFFFHGRWAWNPLAILVGHSLPYFQSGEFLACWIPYLVWCVWPFSVAPLPCLPPSGNTSWVGETALRVAKVKAKVASDGFTTPPMYLAHTFNFSPFKPPGAHQKNPDRKTRFILHHLYVFTYDT